jgi:hypothetical protein
MNIRRLLRWLASLAMLILWTASARAQQGELPSNAPEGRTPVLGYFLAFIFTVGTLVVVCMPSRKST